MVYKNNRSIYDRLITEYDQGKLYTAIETLELIGPDFKEILRDYKINPNPGFAAVDLDLPIEL